MTQKVLPMLSDPSCESPLLAAMTATLQASGTYSPDNAADGEGAVADIEIEDCGLRLVDTVGMQVASYVNLISFYPKGRRVLDREKFKSADP